ncbi:alpha,alpha-trehalase nth1 [Pleosporales sp. CAS-2024a]
MRTSRISRDTSRIVAATSRTYALRQTRTPKPPPPPSETNSELSSADSYSASEAETDPRPAKKQRTAPIAIKQEIKEEIITSVASPKRPRKARRAPAKKIKGEDGSIAIEPPANWEEMYALTREMRNENIAPVDTMGCESLAERTRTPRDQRFQTLVALMLSSQTKDTVTAVAMRNMQENMPGGFTLESMLAIAPPDLNAMINKVGFHNLKTKYIKQTAELLRDKWNGDIPDSIEGLVSLPGVGPKMAYLTMSAAWGRDEGIGVDVHVHRITNLWGWHGKPTQNPEQTRAALESWLPKDKWHDINNLLVGFGQTICLPVGRKCGECKLADRGLCPSAVVAKTAKAKKEAVVEMEGGEVVKHEEIVAEVGEIKAEHVGGLVKTEVVETAIGDIEDIGKKRTPRKRS